MLIDITNYRSLYGSTAGRNSLEREKWYRKQNIKYGWVFYKSMHGENAIFSNRILNL